MSWRERNHSYKPSFQKRQKKEEGPFILVNFNLRDLKKKFLIYVSWFPTISVEELKFCCLDCEPITKREISGVETHFIGNHSIEEHECADEKCRSVAFFCKNCKVLFISAFSRLSRLRNLPWRNHECCHGKLVETIFSFAADYKKASKWEYFFNRLNEHLIDSKFKCVYLTKDVSGWCSRCQVNVTDYKELSLHVSLPQHCRYSHLSQMTLFFCSTCCKINLLVDLQSSTCICGDCKYLYTSIYDLYLNMCNVSDAQPKLGKLKSYPDVYLKNNFSEELSNISLNILTSRYEQYKLVVPLPLNSSVLSIGSSLVHKDIPLSFLTSKISGGTGVELEYECLICDELVGGLSEFCSHAGGEEHVSRCFLATHQRDIIPYMTYCENCSLNIISLEVLDLERHFSSVKHLKKSHQTDINSVYQDDDLWWMSNPSKESLDFFNSIESVNEVVDKVHIKLEESCHHFDKIKGMVREDVLAVLKSDYPNVKLYFFDMLTYGLVKQSDGIQIFVDLDNNYWTVNKNPKENTKKLSDIFKSRAKGLVLEKMVLKTFIPYMKIWHSDLERWLFIECFNGMLIEKTKLFKFFIDIDERTKFLLTTIMEWGTMNKIIGVKDQLNKNETVFWMVVFFLQQPHISILPSVQLLKTLYHGQPLTLNGWDISFCLDVETVKKNFSTSEKTKELTLKDLIMGFFKFYSTVESDETFLCPFTGKFVPKRVFEEKSNVYVNSNNEPVSPNKKHLVGPLCILDPIEFDFIQDSSDNKEKLWKHFQFLCIKTLSSSHWFKE